MVATIAYLGFLAGPVYVGRWADSVELPGAMLALAVLAAILAVVAPICVHRLTWTDAAGATGVPAPTDTASPSGPGVAPSRRGALGRLSREP